MTHLTKRVAARYGKKKWVYGTRDKKWHLVGPDDRDYDQGISQEEFKKLGPARAKQQYLGGRLIGR